MHFMSPLPIHFVLLTVHCSTALCTFVTCGSGWCDGLLAVLNGDWTDVDIHIVDVMWFVTCGSGWCDGLLAVLNGDWTDVDIHIVDVMWFVQLKPIMPLFCTKIRHCKKQSPLSQWQSAVLWIYQLMNALQNELLLPLLQPQHHSNLDFFNIYVF